MHGPTCTFWANLTAFSLQRKQLADIAASGVPNGAAALDPAAFLETIRARPRTNVTCSLEDHAEMILGFNK